MRPRASLLTGVAVVEAVAGVSFTAAKAALLASNRVLCRIWKRLESRKRLLGVVWGCNIPAAYPLMLRGIG
tara:strand:+ start:568 stop:780 length:213 start_codon:yes stop_codon:yes gene_type:complete